MDNEETTCSIQQLPYEVLCKIFDYLDLRSVKQCSCTCRRWKSTIFSDYYIKRFQLTVTFPMFENDTIHVLEQSDRLYWNMDISLCSDDSRMSNVRSILNGVYIIFCYPKLEQLVALNLSIAKNSSNCIKMITDAIARMKVLRELCIENNIPYSYNTEHKMVRLQIRSKSVQLLILKDVQPTWIKAPQLSALRILNRHCYNNNGNLEHHNEKRVYFYRLPGLKSLEIEHVSAFRLANIKNTEYVLRFFHNLQHLEKLDLKNVILSGHLFKTICEACTNLKELSIETLFILEICTLQKLSNLAELRHLQLKNITCLEPVSFRSIQLPNLESLGIGSFPLHYETLDAFKSVTKITILSRNITRDFIVALAIKIPNLKHVKLTEYSETILQALNLLTSVEVLTVPCITAWLFNVQPGSTTIKEIHSLMEIVPSSSEIASLRLLFPTLQLLTAGKSFKYRIQN